MALWLFIYAAGIMPALLATSLIAYVRREAHQMPGRSVAKLTVSAGLVWPLLAVAAVQVAGLLVLKAGLGLVRGSAHDAEVAAEVPAVSMPQPLAAAAAA